MRKILVAILPFILSVVFLLQTQSGVYAADCTSISPKTIPQGTKNVNIDIGLSGQPSGEYQAHLIAKSVSFTLDKGKGTASFSNLSTNDQGAKTLRITNKSGSEVCKGTITVTPPQSDKCKISITSSKIDPDTRVGVNVEGITPGSYGIYVDGSYKHQNSLPGSFTLQQTFPTGVHKIKIYSCTADNCNLPGGSLECPETSFNVGTHDNPASPPKAGGTDSLNVPGLLNIGCASDQISTAVGCIPVGNPAATIKWFLGWAMGIAGGIAFLLIVWSGIQMMSASGDPQRLQAGREVLSAAVSGLILIIFSVFLLRLIGINILSLPGF